MTPGPIVHPPIAPKPSIRPGTVSVSPQIGSVDGFWWRGFRQSAPFLSLLESILADTVQLLSSARTLHPFRRSSALRYVPQSGTDLSLASLSVQSFSIEIESLRMQIAFKMTDPANS